MRPRRSASSHSCGPHPVVAGGRGVALVEDEVDAPRAPTRAARRARRRAAPRTARAASASVRLARTMRCAMVGSGTRNARAISSVVRPPSRRSVSATRASVESTGWHAVKMSRSRSSPTSSSSAASSFASAVSCSASRSRPSSSCLRSTSLCRRSRSIARCLAVGHQPRAGIVGHARLRPLLERGDQRVLRQLLGEADVAHHAREPGDQLGRLDAPDRVDRAVYVGGRCIGSHDRYRYTIVEARAR